MSKELFEWLLEFVGEEYDTYWPEDRLYFEDDVARLPKLEAGWRDDSRMIPDDRRNWIWFTEQPRIGFRTPEMAVLFKLRWAA